MITVGCIKADIGAYVGHSAMHPDILGFDNARAEANHIADYLRKHGPFEPHRLPLEAMEHTTMGVVAKKLGPRWQPMP